MSKEKEDWKDKLKEAKKKFEDKSKKADTKEVINKNKIKQMPNGNMIL